MLTIAGGILIAFIVIIYLQQLIQFAVILITIAVFVLTAMLWSDDSTFSECLRFVAFSIGGYWIFLYFKAQYEEDKRKHPNSYPIWKWK